DAIGSRELGGLHDPFAEVGARAPEPVAGRLRDIQAGALDLAFARGGMTDARRRTEHRGHRVDDLVHRGRDARTDVVDAGRGALERREDRVADIGHVHVLALRAAVTEDRDRLFPSPRAEEDRDHSALEILALARAVRVRETERDAAQLRAADDLLGLGLE